MPQDTRSSRLSCGFNARRCEQHINKFVHGHGNVERR